jgi:AcrR family transcriptional regulator
MTPQSLMIQTALSNETTDGRRARRERGRLAVSDAVIDLVFEGNTDPTSEQVAKRAGVSVASLFRYFETLKELRQETLHRYFKRYDHLFQLPDITESTLEHRTQVLVDRRAKLYETTEPMCRQARRRAPDVPDLDEELRSTRAMQADQIRQYFACELEALSPSASDDLVATINTLTSFESWDQIAHDHNRTPQQVRRTWTTALHQLLQPLESSNTGSATEMVQQ